MIVMMIMMITVVVVMLVVIVAISALLALTFLPDCPWPELLLCARLRAFASSCVTCAELYAVPVGWCILPRADPLERLEDV